MVGPTTKVELAQGETTPDSSLDIFYNGLINNSTTNGIKVMVKYAPHWPNPTIYGDKNLTQIQWYLGIVFQHLEDLLGPKSELEPGCQKFTLAQKIRKKYTPTSGMGYQSKGGGGGFQRRWSGVVWVLRVADGSCMGVAGHDVSAVSKTTSWQLLRGEEWGFGLWRL